MMKEQCLRFFSKTKRKFRKNKILVTLEKDILCGEKIFFERVRLTTAKRKKKTEPKGE